MNGEGGDWQAKAEHSPRTRSIPLKVWNYEIALGRRLPRADAIRGGAEIVRNPGISSGALDTANKQRNHMFRHGSPVRC